ncbi:MAG TPA: DUF5723 family protein [Bacteroidales bacterium]|nr:DUF5723 family protein [Bacteroidales bacterium]
MKRKIFMVILLLQAVVFIQAQSGNTLWFMNLPQANTLNPALKPGGRTYIGLPGITDISVRIDNNFLSLSDLFTGGVISDSTYTFLDEGEWLERFVEGLGNNNSVEPQAAVRLLGIAFTVKDDLRLTFDITERADASIVMPGDLMRLGLEGAQDFIGRSIDLSSLRTDVRYYHEIGIGASKNITEKLRVGARALILSGVTSVHLNNKGVTLTVNEDYTHTVNADIALDFSAPLLFITEEDGAVHGIEFDNARFDNTGGIISYMTAFANPGLGIDLGAEYRFNEMFAVSAALTDLGFIKWKRDRTEISLRNTFVFNGLTMQDVYDDSVDFEGELLNWTLDTLQNAMDITDLPGHYTTYLPTTFSAGFGYTPVPWFTAGVLSRTRFAGKQVHQAVTLSGNVNLGNVFSTTLAYTMANRRYDNLGFGLAVRGGFLQFFALVDNIPLRWTRVTSGEDTFRLPENWNTVHVRAGLNLLFGNRQDEKPLPPM